MRYDGVCGSEEILLRVILSGVEQGGGVRVTSPADQMS